MIRLAINAAIVLAILLGLFLAWQLRGVVLIFFASLATSAALRPVAEAMLLARKHRIVALALTYAAAVSGVIGLGLMMVGPLWADLERLPTDITNVRRHVTQTWPHGTRLQQTLVRLMPSDTLSEALSDSKRWPQLVQLLSGVTFGIIEGLVTVTLILVLSLYWSVDRVRFERLWLSLLAVEQRGPARDIWRQIETETGAYLRSEVVQCLSAGLLLHVGFLILGQPYPTLLAMIGALAWLVPWLGGLIAVSAVFLLSIPAVVETGAYLFIYAAPAALFTLVVLSFLEFVVEPFVFERRRYNSLLVALVMIGLADLLGILGLFLGPPLAAAAQILAGHVLRLRMSLPPKGQPDVRSLQDRADELRAEVGEVENDRPQLTNLTDRLQSLIDEADPKTTSAASRSRH